MAETEVSKIPELSAAVLSGGRSTRMGRDKAKIVYGDRLQIDQESHLYGLLLRFSKDVFVSCRADQQTMYPRVDDKSFEGPAAGLMALHQARPANAWLLVACDFPFADFQSIENLVRCRDSSKAATAYINANGIIEPLFAIWEPRSLANLKVECERGNLSPRHLLEGLDCVKLKASSESRFLINVNTVEDAEKAGLKIGPA